MQRYGITVPFDGIPLAGQRDLFAELPDLGYTDVWSSEVDGADAFTPLVLASVWAPALRLGTAIAPVFTRGPATLAQCAASLAAAAPGRVAIGIGASSDVIVERWNGIEFDRPLQRVRDTARFLRAALAGEKVTERYETFAVDGFRLGLVPDPPPKLLVAALRPGMLRLAGRESDGAILNWLAPGDVGTVSPVCPRGRPGPGDRGPHLRGRHRRPRPGPRPWAAAPSPPTSTCPSTGPSTSGWAGASAWPRCGRRGRPATAGPRSPPSPTTWSTTCSSTAPRRPAGSGSGQYAEAGVHTPILSVLPVGGDIRDTVRALAPAAG